MTKKVSAVIDPRSYDGKAVKEIRENNALGSAYITLQTRDENLFNRVADKIEAECEPYKLVSAREIGVRKVMLIFLMIPILTIIGWGVLNFLSILPK